MRILPFSKYLYLFNFATPARRPLQLPILQTSILFDLPEELVLHILSYLDINDLLGCAEVCHLFARLVHKDVRLQLAIELRRSGMVEGASGPSGATISDRHAALRQYTSRFQRTSAFSRHCVDLGSGVEVEWSRSSDGSICYIEEEHSIDATRFCVRTTASGVRNVQTKTWILQVGRLAPVGAILGTVYDGTVDVAQDLAVLPICARGTTIVTFHILSLERLGASHPKAAYPVLHTEPSNYPGNVLAEVFTDGLEIRGRYIAYVLRSGSADSADIEVWDWPSGQKVWHQTYETHRIYHALIGDEHIAVGFGCESKLEIYRIQPGSTAESTGPITATPLYTLCLPLPAEVIMTIDGMYSSHPPHPTQDDPRLFQTDPETNLVAVSFTVSRVHNSQEHEHGCTLLIPRSTFLAYAAGASKHQDAPPGPRIIPWAEWGTRGSVLLRCAEAHSARVALRPFGSAFPLVCVDGPTPPPWPSAILDLNPHAAAHGRRDPGALARVRPMLFDDPERPDAYKELFAEEVRTELPYAVYAGPRLFHVGNSRLTARVDMVDGGLVGMYYRDMPAYRTLGFDIYTV